MKPVIAPAIFIVGQMAPAITGEIRAKFALPGFRTYHNKSCFHLMYFMANESVEVFVNIRTE